MTRGLPPSGGLASPLKGSQPPPGLSLPWPSQPLEELHSHRAAPSTACPLEELHSPETPEKALPSHGKSASIVGWSCQFQLPWGNASLSRSGPASSSHTQKVLHSCGAVPSTTRPLEELRSQKRQSKLCPAMKVCIHHGVDLPVLPALGKSSFASE